MKKTFNLIAVMLISVFTFAQNNSKEGNPDNIILSPFIPAAAEEIPQIAVKNLENKLSRIVTSNGLGAGSNQRFIISANVNVLTKDITPTAPPMHAYTLDVTFYIGDGIDGKLFSTTSITLKGVGETDTKAYISALKNIKENNPDFKSFIATGKQKILDYYRTNCDLILKEAKTYSSTNDYERSIASLMAVPMANTACYNKALDESLSNYKKMIDRDCKIKLNEANAIWSAGQSYESASSAAAVLASVDPDASCFSEVKTLYSSIKSRVTEIDTREWNYVLKDRLQESERIKAIQAIGVAYGSNQKATTVHYKTLW
jgi:hypothetical protein